MSFYKFQFYLLRTILYGLAPSPFFGRLEWSVNWKLNFSTVLVEV